MRIRIAWVALLAIHAATSQGKPTAAPVDNSTALNSDGLDEEAPTSMRAAAPARSDANAAPAPTNHLTPAGLFNVVHVGVAPGGDVPSPTPPPPLGVKLNFGSTPLAPQPSSFMPGHRSTDPSHCGPEQGVPSLPPRERPTENTARGGRGPVLKGSTDQPAQLQKGQESGGRGVVLESKATSARQGGLEAEMNEQEPECTICCFRLSELKSQFYKSNCNCPKGQYPICEDCVKSTVNMRRKRTGRVDRSCNFCRKQDVYPGPDHWNADSPDEFEFDSSDEDSVISDDHMIGLMQGNIASGRKQASSIRKGGRREPVKFPSGDDSDSDSSAGDLYVPSAPKRRQARTMKQIMADADRMDEDFGDSSDSDESVPQRPAAASARAGPGA